ncbi:MAG: guanylate kinase [Victivallaceae bacterium]
MGLINQNSRLGVALIVSGPSGTGKSTVCSRVRAAMPELKFSVSCTTRAPRAGEQHGRDYYFLSLEEFKARIASLEFIEYAEVFGNFYGTLKNEVIDRVSNGEDVFLDIDIQGAMQIRECSRQDPLLEKCCEFIFVAPPSLEELERRLRNRASDSEEQILKRLGKSTVEISHWKSYDYLIINDVLDTAVEDMQSLIQMTRKATKRMAEELFNV